MKNRIVTLENVKIGMKVIRGRDWEYYDQDGDAGYGIISDSFSKEPKYTWYEVEWENGRSNHYRVGSDESQKCDLYFYEEELIKPEFIGAVKKHFRVNKLDSITKEMLEEANLTHYLI